jgi:hypothetical protein
MLPPHIPPHPHFRAPWLVSDVVIMEERVNANGSMSLADG